MKTYTLKLIIVFITAYSIFSFIAVFFYSSIENTYLNARASETIENINLSVATRIDQSIAYDLYILNGLMEEAKAQGLNVKQTILTQYQTQQTGVSMIADLLGNGIFINQQLYAFNLYFDPELFNNFMNILPLSSILESYDDDTIYIILNYEGMLIFIDAHAYFDPLFVYEGISRSYYLIMADDNQIFLQENQSASTKFFFQYLRNSNIASIYIDQMQEKLYAGEIFSVDSRIFDEKVFIGFAPLAASLSSRQLYVVQIFPEASALAQISYLRNLLIAVFATTMVVLVSALYVLYIVLNGKNNDLELPRLAYYYQKPFIIRISRNGLIKYANKRFNELITQSGLSIKKISDIEIEDYEPTEVIDQIRKQHPITLLIKKDQIISYIHCVVLKSYGSFILVGDDITYIQGKYDNLKALTLFDERTKLPNRNQFIPDLKVAIEDVKKLDEKKSIVLIEVTSLERVERLMSEKIVLLTLDMVTSKIKKHLKDIEAYIYHISSNQFALIFHNLESYEKVEIISDDIYIDLKDPFAIDKNLLEIELRFGIFHIELDKYTVLNEKIAYEHVNLALEHSKQSDDIKLMVYDLGLTQYTSREQIMEEDLAHAIKNNEFDMYLQPQYHSGEQRIVGFEALIRWNHPKYINESPLKFIKLAEKNNMIIEIGNIALIKSFEMAKRLEAYDVQISINVSPVQVMQVGFVSELIEKFQEHKLRKNAICIEITETFLMTSFEAIIEKLKKLQAHGFHIHLDDFGTGYSSLQYLRDLPINSIKIDRAFIDQIVTDSYSRAIIQMIANLAKNIQVDLIAEGVERDKQYQILMKNGYQIFQGYYFSKAVTEEIAVQMLKDYNINKTKSFELTSSQKRS